ncbi:MAG: GNAT family N-acetyltransferase, partial [Elusimicrobia bacterium]|nr:GNAT family N-acetyltransferase [Elusimicrobiota bacterium]
FRRAFGGVLRDRDSGIFVSCRQGRLIGLLAWSLRPMLHIAGRLFRIDELVVSNAARGQGVGRELLRAAHELARRRGALRIELLTNRKRESYRRGFYAKNGFDEADTAVFRSDIAGARTP